MTSEDTASREEGKDEGMSETDVQALADEVNALTPPARLRLAAGPMEARRSDTALLIIRRVANELELALRLREMKAKWPAPRPERKGR